MKQLRSFQVPLSTVNLIKKEIGQVVTVTLDGKEQGKVNVVALLEMKPGDKWYFSATPLLRTELVRAVYNRKAQVQVFGSKVTAFMQYNTQHVTLEVTCVRVPNISVCATGIELALHPESVFIKPLMFFDKCYHSIEHGLHHHALNVLLKELFIQQPIYMKAIEQMGGLGYCRQLHYEGVEQTEYTKTIENVYHRVQYEKSVSRYE